MEFLRGMAAAQGVAVGPAWILDPALAIRGQHISHDRVRGELLRFEHALATTESQLGHSRSGSDEGELADDYEGREDDRELLIGASLASESRRLIREEELSAETAVRLALDHIGAAQEGMTTPERDSGVDPELVGDRLLRVLCKLPGRGASAPPPRGAVAIARDLHVDEAIALQRAGVTAIATEHASEPLAAVARALGLPYVADVSGIASRATDHMTVAVDGNRGRVILEPDEPTLHDLIEERGEPPR
jgi:phosphotransferase system enzyme I (PtsI)